MNHFKSEFFAGNRAKLSEKLPNSLIVIAAHSMLQESADTAFPFRQDSNFWYLTGINEPDLVLVIDAKMGESTLLLPAQNEYQKDWDGALDDSELKRCSGIPLIATKLQLEEMLIKAKKEGRNVCHLKPTSERIEPYGFYANPARRMLESEIKKVVPEPTDIRMIIAKLRQIKQPVEIHAIQQAIDVTAKTLKNVKSNLQIYKTEKDVERAISSGFFKFGSDGHAYSPIVASGMNAATIHYSPSDTNLERSGMLLIDVGAKVNGYAADISRTWSFGEPSKRQIEVYNEVLVLQQKAYSILKPGVSIRDYQKKMEIEAEKSFVKLKCSMAGKRFPHGFSHYLGFDVHDAGNYEAQLEENTVLTVEPGIYLPDEGIGVRIEDDVIITKNGVDILSKNIPSELI